MLLNQVSLSSCNCIGKIEPLGIVNDLRKYLKRFMLSAQTSVSASIFELSDTICLFNPSGRKFYCGRMRCWQPRIGLALGMPDKPDGRHSRWRSHSTKLFIIGSFSQWYIAFRL